MSVDECTRTVGGVQIGLPHAVCVRHLRYVYTHARSLRCYGRSLTGTDDWGRSDAMATLGNVVCTLTARPDGMPTRTDGHRRCVYTKVRQPTHLQCLCLCLLLKPCAHDFFHWVCTCWSVRLSACFPLACPIFYFNLNLYILDIFILLFLYFSLCNKCTLYNIVFLYKIYPQFIFIVMHAILFIYNLKDIFIAKNIFKLYFIPGIQIPTKNTVAMGTLQMST